jgi:hypothetical protein
MKYRQATILAEKTLDASGTETIPINVKDPISRITLLYRAKRVAYNMAAHLAENISKIELVDGSDVLFSLNGSEVVGLNTFNNRINSPVHSQYYVGNSMVVPLSLDFGRRLYDPALALLPDRFSNLQLKITYNEVTFDASAVDSYLAVYGDLFDEKVISPVGFLMAKEHQNTAMGASTYSYVDLPTDHEIRLMLLRAFLTDYEPWYTLNQVRLSEDNDKRVVFDWGVERYHQMRKGLDLPVIEGQVCLVMTDGSAKSYITATDFLAVTAGLGEIESTFFSDAENLKGGALNMDASAAGTYNGLTFGWLPCHCIQFPFGDQQDLDDWYDVTKKGSVRLRLLGGSSSPGIVQTCLQQLRKY